MLTDSGILSRGGVVLWIIFALSIVALAIILWKSWALWRMGAWRDGSARRFADGIVAGQSPQDDASDLRLDVARAAVSARAAFDADGARQETERVARAALLEARVGLRALDAIATAAPLLGLLGTVLGMIAAFQALQESGARADPSVLAGGIWEALLTTAAGMGVAIPASLALAWFDGVIERVAADMEDIATRILLGRHGIAA